MGLYLCIYDADDNEIDGLEVGSYADFATLRETVNSEVERAEWGSRFPVLMNHSDCDGEWSPTDAERLLEECGKIEAAFRKLPARHLEGWQAQLAAELGLRPSSLYESFFDVDGTPLLEGLQRLAQVSGEHQRPISFQ